MPQAAASYRDIAAEHAAVRAAVGIVDRGDHGLLEVTGRDRAKFLHAILSNDITALAAGQGRAATLLDVHGKVQVLLRVLALDDRLLVITPPDLAAKTNEALGTYLFSRWLVQTPFGRVLVSIRENEGRTESFGYDVRRFKLWVFTVAGAIAGISGLLFSTMGSYISPWSFNFVLSAESVIWVMLGGRGTLVGAFLGALVVQLLENILSGAFLYYWLLILGIGFVATVLVLPEGLMGLVREWQFRGATRARQKPLAAEKV